VHHRRSFSPIEEALRLLNARVEQLSDELPE